MKIWKWLFAIWLLIVIYVTVIYKLSFGIIFWDVESIGLFTNFIPFDFIINLIRNYNGTVAVGTEFSIPEVIFFIKDFILNVCLFIPCGICMKKMKIKSLKSIVVSFFIVSGLEIIQLAFRLFNIGSAIFDINDIIGALIGSAIGVVICNVFSAVKKGCAYNG